MHMLKGLAKIREAEAVGEAKISFITSNKCY